ncbi:protein of unknown function [Rhodovastum atsumiense]|nr:protein of unknown function [Rhodovastum atsumiense]
MRVSGQEILISHYRNLFGINL